MNHRKQYKGLSLFREVVCLLLICSWLTNESLAQNATLCMCVYSISLSPIWLSALGQMNVTCPWYMTTNDKLVLYCMQ